jgi:excisionase family DNA binding protein
MSNTTHHLSPAHKLAFRIDEFCRAFGVGRSKFYELVARHEIRPVKSAKQTLIPVAEAERWLASLPPFDVKTSPRWPRGGQARR